MATKQDDRAGGTPEDKGAFRDQFSLLVFRYSFWFLVGLAFVVMALGAIDAYAPGVGDGIGNLPKDMLAIILPIVSGWVGVVLGYYFSDKAADARGRQVMEAQTRGGVAFAEKLRQVPVREVMVAMSRIRTVIMANGDCSGAGNAFRDLKDVVSEPRYTRAPMFRKVGERYYFCEIAHESAIYKFDSSEREAGRDPDAATIDSFLQSTTFLRGQTAFVSQAATLEDARIAMQTLKGCQDVFITETGDAEGAVVGWLTNVDVLRWSVARAED